MAHLASVATAVFGMSASDRIRQWAVSLDLLLSRLTSGLEKIPLLGGLHPEVTADVEILGKAGQAEIGLRVGFRSPYLGLPLEFEKSQIGSVGEDGRLRPTAFRFFDWQTWRHIDGEVEWTEERRREAAILPHRSDLVLLDLQGETQIGRSETDANADFSMTHFAEDVHVRGHLTVQARQQGHLFEAEHQTAQLQVQGQGPLSNPVRGVHPNNGWRNGCEASTPALAARRSEPGQQNEELIPALYSRGEDV